MHLNTFHRKCSIYLSPKQTTVCAVCFTWCLVIEMGLKITYSKSLPRVNKLSHNIFWDLTVRLSWRMVTLQWRHDERDGVSDDQPHECLLDRLFRRRSKKTSKLRVTGLCEGNSLVTGGFPAQKARNAENVSIWWRHHDVTFHEILRPIFFHNAWLTYVNLQVTNIEPDTFLIAAYCLFNTYIKINKHSSVCVNIGLLTKLKSITLVP